MSSRPKPALAVAYDCVESPTGPIWFACTGRGVVRISLRCRSERSFLSALRRERRGVLLEARRDRRGTAMVRRELAAYFRGRARTFGASLDLGGLTPFQRRVLEATARVEFGRVASYGDIAKAIGSPGAARAVGNALGANPIPILIPCHRIVASGGTIGGFTGGTGLKRALLRMEGIRL